MIARHSYAHRQRGLSLVEMMVAMTIGLILTAVVLQVFLSNKQTYRFNDAMSEVQNKGRFAIQLLSSQLQQAGWHTDVLDTAAEAVPNTIQGTNNSGTSGSDTITVRYQGTADCIGTAIAAGAIADNVFSIGTGANGRSSLFCNGTAVVDGVENMQILYGEDTDADGSVNTYRTAAAANMANVKSVRLEILVATDLEVGSDTAAKQYNLLGTAYGPFNDRRLRRVYGTTVQLRNM